MTRETGRQVLGPVTAAIFAAGLIGVTPWDDAHAAPRNGPVVWAEQEPDATGGRDFEDGAVRALRDGKPVTLAAHRRNVVVSPTGRWMLTEDSDLDGSACRIRLTDLVTGHERALGPCDGSDDDYRFSPHGHYLTLPDTLSYDTFLVDARTGARRNLGPVGVDWSPDGRRLLVADAKRHRARVLDTRTGRFSRACGRGDSVLWSPAGRMVLVGDERRRASNTLCTRSGRRISRLPGEGYGWAKAPSRITHEYSTGSGSSSRDDFAVLNRYGRVRWRVRDATQPSWTRHGRVAFLRPEGDESNALWIARSDGRHRRRVGRLPGDFDKADIELTWSPDGRSVVATAFDQEFPWPEASVIASASHRGLRELAGTLRAYSPDGRRTLLDGKWLYTADARGRHLHRIPGAPERGRVVTGAAWPRAPR